MGKCKNGKKHKWSDWQVEMLPRAGTLKEPVGMMRGRMCTRCRKWQLQQRRYKGDKWV